MLTNCEDELVLNNFLSILAKDIENCPQNLVPMTVEKFIKIFSLVEDIKIDLETPLDEEDDVEAEAADTADEMSAEEE